MTTAELDALLADADAAVVAGRPNEALAGLTVVNRELLEQGRAYESLYVRMGQLELELGDHGAAEAALEVAHAIAAEHDHAAWQFRAAVLRARVACDRQRLDDAESLLSGLRGNDGSPLGPLSTARRESIVTWLKNVRFPGRMPRDLSALAVEAALAIAELWSERGQYRSSLLLADAFSDDLPRASDIVHVEQVGLLRVEWLLAAGRLVEARAQLEALPAPVSVADRLRITVVRARIALATGRLADAVSTTEILGHANPDDPRLFAMASAVRVAISIELNLLREAEEAASAAAARIEAYPAHAAPLRQLSALAARRARSAALWELPLLSPSASRQARSAAQSSVTESAGAPGRFTAAWSAAANDVLLHLESKDVTSAARRQAELEALTRGAESDYIRARVELLQAMLAYYRGEAPVGELLQVAGALRAMGASLAESQAVRHAAWAAARRGNIDAAIDLTRRAAEIIDEIGAELPPEERVAFMLNKWSGRDELVSGRVRELHRGPDESARTPTRRELCRLFREVDALTTWPIEKVLGNEHANHLVGDENAILVMEWIRERLAIARRRRAGYSVRGPLSLWRFPRKSLCLHYHVLPDRTYLFRIARRHLDLKVLPYGRLHFHGDVSSAVASNADLRELANRLGLADALKDFPRTRHLIVVPHDVVADMPFAALIMADSPNAMIPVTQLDSLGRLRRRPLWRRPYRRFLGVAVSRYAGSGLPSLAAASREVELVCAIASMGRARPIDEDSPPAAIIDALRAADLVHIAAHGNVDRDAPEQSGIVLRDGNQFRTLTLRDIRDVDLRRMRLVTLATCRSAESAKWPGRERICLTSAFLDAGARGVIASLWPIYDEESPPIMAALYGELLSSAPAEALAKTQYRMRTEGRPARDWAGLVFYGNP